MTRRSQAACLAVLSIMWCGVSASAETLRCRSVNGNLNCAGSKGVSCQTVDGKKVCVSGGGGVVQSFGGAAPADNLDDPTGLDDEDLGPSLNAKAPYSHGSHALIPDRD